MPKGANVGKQRDSSRRANLSPQGDFPGDSREKCLDSRHAGLLHKSCLSSVGPREGPLSWLSMPDSTPRERQEPEGRLEATIGERPG